MEFISLPACNDTTANSLFWVVALACIAGKLVHSFITKFDLFDEEVRPYLIGLLVVGFISWGVFYALYTSFTGVSVGDNIVRLHYMPPRAPITLDAASIDDVDVSTNLQSYRPGRRWKHSLNIATNQKKEYESVDVCIPDGKVGPDYYSAIFTKINDPVEKAVEAIKICALKAKLSSAKVKSEDPASYVRMLVGILRKYSYIAASKEYTPQQQKLALQKLNEYLVLTKQAFGENLYPVGLVYRFIGRSYGYRGDLKNARIAFAEAAKRKDDSDHRWDKACTQMNEDGLSLYQFENPDCPKSSHYAGEF